MWPKFKTKAPTPNYTVYLNPEKDITVLELAEIVVGLTGARKGIQIKPERYNKLDETVKRHLKFY